MHRKKMGVLEEKVRMNERVNRINFLVIPLAATFKKYTYVNQILRLNILLSIH
jgi:hypothetical protein